MVIIKNDFSFSAFEFELAQARKHQVMRIPINLLHAGAWGNDAAIIQLIISWARHHKSPTLKTYINDSENPERSAQISEYGDRPHGIAALYMANEIHTAQNKIVDYQKSLSHIETTLQKMDSCDIHKSESVGATYKRRGDKIAAQFMCIHGLKYEFLESLYNERSRSGLINRNDFNNLLKSTLSLKPQYQKYLEAIPEFCRSLSSIIYELFENTNSHAYEDAEGHPYQKNIRFLSIKEHSLFNKNLEGMKTENMRFNEYLEFCTKRFADKNLKSLRFIEISVVDGGPGMAAKYSGKSMSTVSIDEEYRITANCFRDGVTSKGPLSRGDGLSEVWKMLNDLHGFIRVRTGRVCLFQAFHDQQTRDRRFFFKWNKNALAAASGTSFTIIIPCFL